MEDPRQPYLASQITRVEELANQGGIFDPDNAAIFRELIAKAGDTRQRCYSSSLGKSIEEMPRWTSTLKEWLGNLEEPMSKESAKGLYNYLLEIDRQIKLLSSSAQENI